MTIALPYTKRQKIPKQDKNDKNRATKTQKQYTVLYIIVTVTSQFTVK